MTTKFTNIPQQKQPTFPGLYQHRNGFIVLATGETTGTVVDTTGTRMDTLGHYCSAWISFSNQEEWTQVWGTIEFAKG